MRRRDFLRCGAALAGAGATGCTAGRAATAPIKVGILHSITGNVALAEGPIKNAELLAIEEINESGGLLGRQILPVIVDGRSDWPSFAAGAERLLTRDRVSVIFGCYTSASRKTIVPVVERLGGLLVYPTFYEGMEVSPNVIYTGGAPNQFIIPAVKWFFDNRGTKFFLVGSDYVFPRSSNAIVVDQLRRAGGVIAGEAYIPLGATDVDAVVEEIIAAKPQVILSSIVGDTNIPFFRRLRAAGITPREMPTLSIVLTESELRLLTTREMLGNYIALNYFQSIGSRENASFIRRFRHRFGAEAVLTDPMEAAYAGVHLWAKAVRQARRLEPQAVLSAIGGQSFAAPGGQVYVDELNHHLWKWARIGQIRADGQVDIVWESEALVHPVPYPPFRDQGRMAAHAERSLYPVAGRLGASGIAAPGSVHIDGYGRARRTTRAGPRRALPPPQKGLRQRGHFPSSVGNSPKSIPPPTAPPPRPSPTHPPRDQGVIPQPERDQGIMAAPKAVSKASWPFEGAWRDGQLRGITP